MKYTVRYSGLFKRSFKRCLKRGCKEENFRKVLELLGNTGSLPANYKPHKLTLVMLTFCCSTAFTMYIYYCVHFPLETIYLFDNV